MKETLIYNSPFTPLEITVDDDCLLRLEVCERSVEGIHENRSPLMHEVVSQLDAYFEGRLHSFDLPFRLQGTDFQKKVWTALCNIPFGTTCSYGELATNIGHHNAMRAVGGACHCNHILLVVPCHRVIGANGALVGFGAGLSLKRELLEMEARYLDTHS